MTPFQWILPLPELTRVAQLANTVHTYVHSLTYLHKVRICFAQTMQNCVKSWLVRTQDRTLEYVDETFSSPVSLFLCTEVKFLHLFITLHSISCLFPLSMLVVVTSKKLSSFVNELTHLCRLQNSVPASVLIAHGIEEVIFVITVLKKLGHEIDLNYF